MKINIFSYGFWPEKFLINTLSRSLSKNHTVFVSTGLPNYPKGQFFKGYSAFGPFKDHYSNIEIRRHFVFPRKKGFIPLALNYATNLLFGILNIFRLPKSDINFVFATSPIFTAIPAIFHSKIFGGKTVIWLQDLWPESFSAITKVKRSSILYKVIGVIVRWIYKRTDLILVQSEAFKENLRYYGYEGRVEWIPNWAISSEESKSEASWIGELDEAKFIITFAGNIGLAQKLETLLDAAEKLKDNPNLFFAIVGDGQEKQNLSDKYSNLNNVKFFGQKPVEDMIPLFKKSSALVVMLKNDIAFSQVIPSKMQSYMKASKPIITSLNGEGARVATRYKIGPVVEAENSTLLAEEIENLFQKSEEERRVLGENAFKTYEQYFKAENVMNRIEMLLKDIV